jgi:uncharacterized protein (UPF0335 family)
MKEKYHILCILNKRNTYILLINKIKRLDEEKYYENIIMNLKEIYNEYKGDIMNIKEI